jgi:hypothetical protein
MRNVTALHRNIYSKGGTRANSDPLILSEGTDIYALE